MFIVISFVFQTPGGFRLQRDRDDAAKGRGAVRALRLGRLRHPCLAPKLPLRRDGESLLDFCDANSSCETTNIFCSLGRLMYSFYLVPKSNGYRKGIFLLKPLEHKFLLCALACSLAY